jgi:hypothetical protein
MAGAAVDLAEPQVLAHTKRRLFPDADEPGTYAVCDTQFATEEWLLGRRVPAEIRESLAPFNHVRLGSGYPDLVGVGGLGSEWLAVDRVGDARPLVVVEAKGYTEGGAVDTERGIVQAYDRLAEANAAYLAAPAAAVSETDRTLARELNVGVLAVEADGHVAAVEVPRVVGNRVSDEASAIRFQATAQGVTERSFGLNHPKNYLGYALALAHPGETDTVLAEYVVGATADARRGAAALELVAEEPSGPELAPLGREVVRFALDRHGSVPAALGEFEGWKRSGTRFTDLAPAWGQLARRVLWAHRATRLLVTELETMYEDGIPEPTLVDLVEWLHVQHPTFAVELFVRGTDEARSRVLDGDGELCREALRDGNVYHSPTVFQLKAMCYHVGLLTEKGSEPHRLDPTSDVWALRDPAVGR